MGGNQYCVLAECGKQKNAKAKLGRKLAKFHERGRMVPFQIERLSRIGQWKELWEKRLEQMERCGMAFFFKRRKMNSKNMFIDSFPYYIGITENAIQYLVDTEIDDEPTESDNGTVCHERFSRKSWGANYLIKNPFDWVLIIEVVICGMDEGTLFPTISKRTNMNVKQFFSGISKIAPLSSFSWRLLYSRVLFPLHYFECVENYYITRSEQDKKVLRSN